MRHFFKGRSSCFCPPDSLLDHGEVVEDMTLHWSRQRIGLWDLASEQHTASLLQGTTQPVGSYLRSLIALLFTNEKTDLGTGHAV